MYDSIHQVASRSAWLVAGCVIATLGLFGKFGAAFAIVPEPIIGGMNICGLGMLSAIGISVLRHCDMSSIRNLLVFGTALMSGLMMPFYMQDNPGLINTGEWTVSISLRLMGANCRVARNTL